MPGPFPAERHRRALQRPLSAPRVSPSPLWQRPPRKSKPTAGTSRACLLLALLRGKEHAYCWPEERAYRWLKSGPTAGFARVQEQAHCRPKSVSTVFSTHPLLTLPCSVANLLRPPSSLSARALWPHQALTRRIQQTGTTLSRVLAT